MLGQCLVVVFRKSLQLELPLCCIPRPANGLCGHEPQFSPLEQERVASLWNPPGHSSSLDCWLKREKAGERGCILQMCVLAFWSSELFSRENLRNRQIPRSAYRCRFHLESGRSQPQPPVILLFLGGIKVLTPRYREDTSCRPRMGIWGSWDGCSWRPWCLLSLLLCPPPKKSTPLSPAHTLRLGADFVYNLEYAQ